MSYERDPSKILTQGDKTLLLLILVAIVSFTMWNIPALGSIRYPFLLLGTWFHEMGHGLTALMVGGQFVKLEIFTNGSGLAHSIIPFHAWPDLNTACALVALGGLMGPAIWGGLFIISGRKESWSAVALLFLVLALGVSSALWIRSLTAGLILGGLGLVMLLVVIKGGKSIKRILIQFLGIQACFSTFLQIDYLFTEKVVVGGKEHLSDSAAIAANTFGSYYHWGMIITVMTMGLLAASIWLAVRTGRKSTN